MVEVNSETDFVARNPDFQALVKGVAEAALGTDGSLEAVLGAPMPAGGGDVDGAIKAAIATIGENITLRRVAMVSVGEGVVGTYVHGRWRRASARSASSSASSRPGRRGQAGADRQAGGHAHRRGEPARRHASTNSTRRWWSASGRSIAEQARESGKPAGVIDKMVEGRLRKFYEEAVLLSQAFVVDTDKTVEKAMEAAAAEAGGGIAVTAFACFRLGEGVEKAETRLRRRSGGRRPGTGQK